MTSPCSPTPESPDTPGPNITPGPPGATSPDHDAPVGFFTRAWSSMRASTSSWRMPRSRVQQEIVVCREPLSFLEQARMSPDIRLRLDDIKDWLTLQDYIDENLEDELILAFLHSCYYDVKAVKIAIVKYVETKVCLPEILDLEYDPYLQSDQMRRVRRNFKVCPLQHNSKNLLIIFVKCINPDPRSFDYLGYHRLLFTILTNCVHENPVRDGVVFVYDLDNFSFGQYKYGYFRTCSLLAKYYQDGLPFRIKSFYLINASYLAITLFNLRLLDVPFSGPKLRDKTHLYKTKHLVRLVRRLEGENVPKDYQGGLAPSCEQLHAAAIEKIQKMSKQRFSISSPS
ncbi:hypothetical protein WDU94_010552 [Cyamophila willieti]